MDLWVYRPPPKKKNNMSPHLKRDRGPKGSESSSNHQFSGDIWEHVSFQGVYMLQHVPGIEAKSDSNLPHDI